MPDRNAPRLVEPVAIDDELCSDLALVEDLGFGARFVLVSRQTVYESGDEVMAVKSKIVLTDDAIRRAFRVMFVWCGRRSARFAFNLLHRVK